MQKAVANLTFGKDFPNNMEQTSLYLPPGPDSTYSSPASSRSRQSSRRHGSTSPAEVSSSPPVFANENFSHNVGKGGIKLVVDELVSPLDPRRFTPTLQASLVAEILSLRRDLEDKAKGMDELEASVHAARVENDSLRESLASTKKETRALRRQIQLIEAGSQTTLTEISKERDNARNDVLDLRKRLEQAQQKARSHEENAERTQSLWDRDRQMWMTNQTALEAKVNIVEGRLKMVLGEIANTQFTNGRVLNYDLRPEERSQNGDSPTKRASNAFRFSGSPIKRPASVSGQRRQSNASNTSVSTRLSLLGGLTNGQLKSLADELALGEEDEEYLDDIEEQDSRTSSIALPEERTRPMSVISRTLSLKARQILGIPGDTGYAHILEAYHLSKSSQSDTSLHKESQMRSKQSVLYVDSSAQFSPPTSPRENRQAQVLGSPETETRLSTAPDALGPQDVVNSPVLASEDTVWTGGVLHTKQAKMVSTKSTQTVETDATPIQDITELADDNMEIFPVPTIAIIPPSTRQNTPHTSVVLPPHTKSIACQAILQPSLEYTSTAMQTEDIRVDTRFHIPTYLRFPAPVDRSEASSADKPWMSAFATSPPGLPPLCQPTSIPYGLSRPHWRPPGVINNLYPPNNDSGPLVRVSRSEKLRPMRSSSLFAGFEDSPDKEASRLFSDRFTEDDMFSRPTLKYTLRSGKLVSQQDARVERGQVSLDHPADIRRRSSSKSVGAASLPKTQSNLSARHAYRSPRKQAIVNRTRASPPKQIKPVSSLKQNNFRRAALISSGATAHQTAHSRSAGASARGTGPPPFPVPIRYSSRKTAFSVSDGLRTPTPTAIRSSPRKGGDNKSRKPPLRKAKSATAISLGAPSDRHASRSPPAGSKGSVIPDSSNMPPLPIDLLTASQAHRAGKMSEMAAGTNLDHQLARTDSETTGQQISIVENMHQTMVGEWMLKYKRRKSFGVPDARLPDWDLTKNGDELTAASATSTAVRHKRWVWLAPYERSIMWSNKQPTSGSTIMGKSGRKLLVQSVLDVKDGNPNPRNSGLPTVFDRSILILTPQRALKFTATTRERHYVWLSALSFLSHSPLGIHDLLALPSLPELDFSVPAIPPRRRPIGDSIRVAKGNGREGARSMTGDVVVPSPGPKATEVDEKEVLDVLNDGAEPPVVPRSRVGRERSDTGPRTLPYGKSPSQIEGSTAQPPGSTFSFSTATSNDLFAHSVPSRAGRPRKNSGRTELSRRTSETSVWPFDTTVEDSLQGDQGVGTVRMEAFINLQQGIDIKSRSNETRRKPKRREPRYEGSDNGIVPMDIRTKRSWTTPLISEDPFRGF